MDEHMNTLVSVIVPVYNAMTSGGGHIRRCIDSVLNQAGFPTSSIELILVNDGSIDNTREILEEIRNRHPATIRVINQKNMGVAAARNNGIDLANGHYIIFIDQDDWIDEDYLQVMTQEAAKNNRDYVIAGYRRPDSTGRITRTFLPSCRPYARYTLGAAWGKIHKRSFLIENAIRFFDNDFGEDIVFTTSENLASQNYAIINYVGYNWFLNKNSVSNNSQIGFTSHNIQSIDRLLHQLAWQEKTMHDKEADPDFRYYCLRTLIFYAIHSGRNASLCTRVNGAIAIMDCAKRQMSALFNGSRLKRMRRPEGEMLGVGLVVTAFHLLHNTQALHALEKLCNQWRKAASHPLP